MALYAPNCFSWRHDFPVPAEAGRPVCRGHVDEERRILQELSDLAEVANDIRLYEAYKSKLRTRRKREHGDSAKALERSLATYFNRILEPDALASEGYREETQLDVVVPRHRADPSFSATARVLHGATGDRIAAHFEVAYRTDPKTTSAKFDEMLDALDESIKQAIRARVQPPFTGVALLGPGWAALQPERLEILARRYSSARRLRVGRTSFWNFPDVIVSPSGAYKKHDLFSRPSATSTRVPCFMPFLTDGHELRPLAIARGYLRHRIRVLRKEALAESSAWPRHEAGAIAGPVPMNFHTRDFATVVLRKRVDVRRLWHMSVEHDEAKHRLRDVFVPQVTSPPPLLWIPGPRNELVRHHWRKNRDR